MRRRDSFYFSFLIIFGILTLSLKDSLNTMHTVLHSIPNPFHYHASAHLRPHHKYSPHTLDDHIKNNNTGNENNIATDKDTKSKNIDTKTEIKLYVMGFKDLDFRRIYRLRGNENLYFNKPFLSFILTPLSPPPWGDFNGSLVV